MSESGTVKSNQVTASVDVRVAVLEQIVIDTKDILVEMKLDIREMRQEFKQDIKDLRSDQETDFRIVFGALIAAAVGLAGLMAHGFHWL